MDTKNNAAARITDLRAALQKISETRFGWEGDCGVIRIADDALYADELAAAPTSQQGQEQAEKVTCGKCSGTGGSSIAEQFDSGITKCSDCNGKGFDWEPVGEVLAVLPEPMWQFIGEDGAQQPAYSAKQMRAALATHSGAEVPPFPEHMGAADLDYVAKAPESWDREYRDMWVALQVALANTRELRKYARQLRAMIAAQHSTKEVPSIGKLADRLESIYDERVASVPLRNCTEWQELRRQLLAQHSTKEVPNLLDSGAGLLDKEAPSIDTPEFRELATKLWKAFSIEGRDLWISRMVHHIDARLKSPSRDDVLEEAAREAEDTDIVTFSDMHELQDDGIQTRANIAAAIRALKGIASSEAREEKGQQ